MLWRSWTVDCCRAVVVPHTHNNNTRRAALVRNMLKFCDRTNQLKIYIKKPASTCTVPTPDGIFVCRFGADSATGGWSRNLIYVRPDGIAAISMRLYLITNAGWLGGWVTSRSLGWLILATIIFATYRGVDCGTGLTITFITEVLDNWLM